MPKKAETPKKRSVIQLSADEARAFFLKGESYFTTDLPVYFRFDGLLSETAGVMGGKEHQGFRKARKVEGVNHRILNNKDGRYSWRPLELIHPVIYVSLVDALMNGWSDLCSRFGDFQALSKIRCFSVPVESANEQTDTAQQVIQWWEEVEQKAIELALDYEFVVSTDIINCYADIYTHSIPWALHTKETAKANRQSKALIGNIIDWRIQDMRMGQTNGIPQGSVLMDFIAEMVLGYADEQLTNKILTSKFRLPDDGYKIIRYRDDYRIFTNNPQHGEHILKCLTEVLIDLGLGLNPGKTSVSNQVVHSSIKPDKLGWLFRKQRDGNLQKRLLIIHDHSMNYPNSGSLRAAMQKYYHRIEKLDECSDVMPLISITADIAYRNPVTYPIAAAILSKLISLLGAPCEKRDVMKRIQQKFSGIPNTGHLDIWLQRISHPQNLGVLFAEPLCQLIDQVGNHAPIWNNEWVSSPKLLGAIDARKVVDAKILREAPPVISPSEVELFRQQY